MDMRTIISGFRPSGLARPDKSCDIEFVRGWEAALERLGLALDETMTLSEKNFGALVEKIREYHGRAREMYTRSSAMAGVMTGADLQMATRDLSSTLEEIKAHLRNPEKVIDQTILVFTEHMHAIRQVTSYLDDFTLLVMNLSMLGFLTQVENAYLSTGSTGFASLTEDVRGLARTIKDKALHIKAASGSVHDFLAKTLQDISAFKSTRCAQAHAVMDNACRNHLSLMAGHAASSDSAGRIDTGARKIFEGIGEIVVSLQFHDITRQQIEHVKEVLSSVTEKIREPGHALPVKAALVRDACSLQAAQLAQSRDELTSAVRSIIENLVGITRGVGDVAREARSAAYDSRNTGSTFLEDLDSSVSSVVECMQQGSEGQAGLSSMVNAAGNMASEMSVFVRDIEHLGLNLQLIALNARIKAAHLGDEGAALDTISGSIYDLSRNAREDTSSLSATLRRLVDLSGEFQAEFQSIQEKQSLAASSLMDRLNAILSALHERNVSVLSMLTDLTEQSGRLMSDIEDTLSHISVHEEVGSLLNGAIQIITHLTTDTGRFCSEHAPGSASSFFSDIDRIYTMESEREIHIRHVDLTVQGAPLPGTTDDRGGLGENVELF